MIKIVILDQSKPILRYLKIKKNLKFKNPKFVNFMFIIKKTEIRQVYNPF